MRLEEQLDDDVIDQLRTSGQLLTQRFIVSATTPPHHAEAVEERVDGHEDLDDDDGEFVEAILGQMLLQDEDPDGEIFGF